VLVRNAEPLEADIRGKVTAPEYMVLGGAELESSDLQAALRYYHLASEQKADPATHAESLRLLANALAMSNTSEGLTQARVAFNDAQTAMARVDAFGAAIERASISRDQILAEAFFGSCSEVPKLMTKFLHEIDGSGVAPEFATQTKAGLARRLSNQQRCAWDRSALVGGQ